MKHYSIKDVKGKTVVSNLKHPCKKCYSGCQTEGQLIEKCPIYLNKRRLGKIENNRGITFLCCDKTKTTKLFKDKLDGLAYAYHDLIELREDIAVDIRKVEQKRVNRLVHNLTSINAHNIQEIYDLVPQEILTADLENQLNHIQKEISSNLKQASLTFLRIAKHNIHMKSEFSIYKKLDRSDPTLDFRYHPIKKVILNVLHTFFVDFSDNEVFVKIEDYLGKIRIDYETIQVALYHLIENASKYVKPKSTMEISFKEIENELKVVFEMDSLNIEDDEIEEIFNEGYSGKNARKIGKSGEGLGLSRIEQMLQLNKGFLEIEKGQEVEKVMGFRFARNKFILSFKMY
jgi:hypothetical protein